MTKTTNIQKTAGWATQTQLKTLVEVYSDVSLESAVRASLIPPLWRRSWGWGQLPSQLWTNRVWEMGLFYDTWKSVMWIEQKLLSLWWTIYNDLSNVFFRLQRAMLHSRQMIYASLTKGDWIYNYLCNQCLSPLMLWVRNSIRAMRTTLWDRVCQWLATVGWFPSSPPASSTNKTDRHDITEILVKMALNTVKQHINNRLPL